MLFVILVKPELFFDALESMTWRWIMFEEAIRLAFAVTVIGAASTSRMPTFLRCVGVLAIAEGVCYAIMGSETLLAINEAMFGQDIGLFRAAVMASLMLMGLVAYGLMPRQDDAGMRR